MRVLGGGARVMDEGLRKSSWLRRSRAAPPPTPTPHPPNTPTPTPTPLRILTRRCAAARTRPRPRPRGALDPSSPFLARRAPTSVRGSGCLEPKAQLPARSQPLDTLIAGLQPLLGRTDSNRKHPPTPSS